MKTHRKVEYETARYVGESVWTVRKIETRDICKVETEFAAEEMIRALSGKDNKL